MHSFTELVAARRQWIDDCLIPWCKTACRRDLLLAEQEWQDLAGRPAPEKTLWFWAWSRFPNLISSDLTALNETHSVSVQCRNGQTFTGYPDARRSQAGQLIILGTGGQMSPPVSIDDIIAVTRL